MPCFGDIQIPEGAFAGLRIYLRKPRPGQWGERARERRRRRKARAEERRARSTWLARLAGERTIMNRRGRRAAVRWALELRCVHVVTEPGPAKPT